MGSDNTSLESISISSIMVTGVKTTRKTQSIQEVCTTMSVNNIWNIGILKGTFVTEDNKIISIVTKRDIAHATVGRIGPFSIRSPMYKIMRCLLNPSGSIRYKQKC